MAPGKLFFKGMTDEKKMKTGREPLYQHNQPVKILISPVKMKN
jgi:hypothetical protein